MPPLPHGCEGAGVSPLRRSHLSFPSPMVENKWTELPPFKISWKGNWIKWNLPEDV